MFKPKRGRFLTKIIEGRPETRHANHRIRGVGRSARHVTRDEHVCLSALFGCSITPKALVFARFKIQTRNNALSCRYDSHTVKEQHDPSFYHNPLSSPRCTVPVDPRRKA